VGLRASEADEEEGLDRSQHGEAAYTLAERGGQSGPDARSRRERAAAVGPEHETIPAAEEANA
jgi:hypothetical protein